MATYLKKHSFENIVVFNRTLSNAKKLSESLGGEAYDLNELSSYEGGFDVMIVCTSSTKPLIDNAIYNQLDRNHSSKKIIIDLGLPANVDKEVIKSQNLVYIDINSLKEQADNNVKLRQAEIVKCEDIISSKVDEFKWLHKERRIELAFGEIPRQIKAIKDVAINEVFTKEINNLDNNSKEVLEKVLSYVEKKYNAVAFKTAKELLLSKND
jgi:glutamyl-tRNA reductase